MGPYSKQSIFFVTYEWAQKARALHNITMDTLSRYKGSSLLGPFVSYKEN